MQFILIDGTPKQVTHVISITQEEFTFEQSVELRLFSDTGNRNEHLCFSQEECNRLSEELAERGIAFEVEILSVIDIPDTDIRYKNREEALNHIVNGIKPTWIDEQPFELKKQLDEKTERLSDIELALADLLSAQNLA